MPHAQWLILLGWLAEGLVLIGLGELFRRLFRSPSRGLEDLLLSFWIGWACLLCGLQIWHLFWPVDGRTVILAAILGAAGLVMAGPAPWAWLPGLRRHALLLIIMAVAVLWISHLSLARPQFGDAGSYHIPLLHWICEYPLVPGLGNLFFPLGYAQSYFLYLGWLDVGPFTGRPYHLANGILLLALAARALLGMARLARRERPGGLTDLYYALFLPAIAEWGTGIFLTTPSPDLAVFALGVVISGELLPFLARPQPAGADRFRLCALTLLTATAVTVKLSIAGLALTAWAIMLAAWWRQERPAWPLAGRLAVTLGAVGAAALAPWLARQAVLTGYPLYPAKLAAVPVEWRVTVDVVETMRQHNGTIRLQDLPMIWQDPQWFLGRLAARGWARPQALFVISLLAGAILTGGLARILRRRPASTRVSMLALAPAVVSFVWCFLGTSVVRFFGATLWLLAIQMILIGVGGAVLERRWIRMAALGAIAGMIAFHVNAAEEPWRRLSNFEPHPRNPTASLPLPSGLIVQVPIGSASCWDAPLPCAPEPNRGLRLRREGDLRWGFVIDPSLQ